MEAMWKGNKLVITDPKTNRPTKHLLGYTTRDMVTKGTKQTFSYGVLDVRYKRTNTIERARELVEYRLDELGFDLTVI